jgi:predicted dehydrogenase
MWGRNLARNLAQLDVLGGVADLVPAHAESFAAEFATSAMNVTALIEDAGLDGVVIAAAAPTHRDLACQSLLKSRWQSILLKPRPSPPPRKPPGVR